MTAPEQMKDLVTEATRQRLSHRQYVDYVQTLSAQYEWMLERGKDYEKYVGLSSSVSSNYIRRLDQIHRLLWDEYDGYAPYITPEKADWFVDQLQKDKLLKQNGEPYAPASKRRRCDALQKHMEWQHLERGGDEWAVDADFGESASRRADEFTREERQQLREAALEYGSIPHYKSLNPDRRDRWKAHLAQRLGKPKEQVTKDDWQQVNRSWKFPSLVMVSLDAGLRPIEVERFSTDWLRLDKKTIYIPKEQSSKNRENWEVVLQTRTADILRRWVEERETREKYDDSDKLWLTRQGNPYKSKSLARLVRKLCEEAGISIKNRKITWYSIRHSTGTHVTDEGNLAQAKEQLRHKNIETTKKYAHPPAETIRDTLNSI